MKNKNRTDDNYIETHPLTWLSKENNETVWIDEYIKHNGYQAAKKAILNMNSKEIISIIKESSLRGRGGAGFYTGMKWSFIPENEDMRNTHYIICNADEMEPGTYKDKFLMEQFPHLLIEGILIAAFATKSCIGYVFIRGEYKNSARIINKAILEAKALKYIGKNIFSSEFSFTLSVHISAGRYICGEETALINALEGNCPNPRSKPPFPVVYGFLGKPTCINNVETLCNIPGIINNGAQWYKSLSVGTDSGTKLMGFSGQVKNPGIWELPMGTTAKDLFENYAGGMINGYELKTWQPGGISTGFLSVKDLNTNMDFCSMEKIGNRLGTGLAIAVSKEVKIVPLLKNIINFFSRESCGFCTPCREGLSWCLKILKSLTCNDGNENDIEMLSYICSTFKHGITFCAHAIGASMPLKSAIRLFGNEIKEHIKNI